MIRLSVRARLTWLCGATFALVATLGFGSKSRIDSLAASLELTNTVADTIQQHMAADMSHDAIRADVFQALLSENDAELADAKDAVETDGREISETIAKLSASTLSPELTRAFVEVRPAVDEYAAVARKVVETCAKDRKNAMTMRADFLKTFAMLEGKLEAISEQLEKFADEESKMAVATSATAQRDILWLGVAILSILLVGGWWITHSIVTPLNKMIERLREIAQGDGDLTQRVDEHEGDELGTAGRWFNACLVRIQNAFLSCRKSSEQVDAGARNLSQSISSLANGAQSQAASLEQTVASVTEITSTIQSTADHAARAKELADKTSHLADEGGRITDDAVKSMQEIEVASKQIREIITTIDEIAFQTNLLALNAAVEAARAGDQGRGFAVVASEVQSLAQRSANAAQEVKKLIGDSVAKIENGSSLVRHSGESLHRIVESIQSMASIVADISNATGEQSSAMGQVRDAMNEIDRVVQESHSGTDRAMQTSRNLAGQAAGLLTELKKFRLSGTQS